MDWIKKNYDKLLLALFGLFALTVGGLLASSAFGGEDAAHSNKVTERSEPGPDKSAEMKQALADLSANAGKPVWTGLKIAEHRTAHLFTASPAVQKAGSDAVLPLLDETTEAIREGIPNWWLYENGLEIERDDVASLDRDGDKFSNAEEFMGKSNPNDPDSRPAFHAKLRLIEVIMDPYEIRNKGIEGNDIQLSRLQPAGLNGKILGKLDYHVGDTLFPDDNRFKISAVEDREVVVDGQKQMVKHVILLDTKDGDKPLAIGVKTTLNLPTYRVKIRSLLSGKEMTGKEGDEISFPDFPTIKIRIKKITPPDLVEIEFTEPGKPAGSAPLKLTK
jgi:hypothetical protein